MIDYVRSSQNPDEASARNLRPAYGISAIQIGHKKKLMFIRIENEFGGTPEEFALINPKIVEKSDNTAYLANGEGCLSVDEEYEGYIHRSYSVKLVATDFFTNREVEIDARGLTAIIFQHEMDHLLGIMFYDRINKLNPFNVMNKSIKIS
jgi:peptide deformylase